MWTRAELKAKAKVAFKNNYWFCVLAAFILYLCGGGSGGSVTLFRNFEDFDYNSAYAMELEDYEVYEQTSDAKTIDLMGISGSESVYSGVFIILLIVFVVAMIFAIAMGAFVFSIIQIGGCRFFTVNAHEKANINEVAFGFSKGYYMKNVKTMFFMNLYIILWSLLFIIPGIIKAYEYRLIPYILADNPDISMEDAFALSKKMMDGDKFNAFLLDLSFFGWNILNAFTIGLLGIFYVTPYMYATNAEFYSKMKSQITPVTPNFDYNLYYN